jgi:hypothetical protein
MSQNTIQTLIHTAPYVAIAATAIIWILTQRVNRTHEIFKERLKRRVEMFDSLLPVMSEVVDAYYQYGGEESKTEAAQACRNAVHKMGSYRVKMRCYGNDDEKRVYEEYMKTIEDRKMDKLVEQHNLVVDLALKNLRMELGFK